MAMHASVDKDNPGFSHFNFSENEKESLQFGPQGRSIRHESSIINIATSKQQKTLRQNIAEKSQHYKTMASPYFYRTLGVESVV